MEVTVESGDPHNDQLAAQANEELDFLLESARKMRASAAGERADEAAMMAVAATALMESDWDKPRFASILAAAALRLTREPS